DVCSSDLPYSRSSVALPSPHGNHRTAAPGGQARRTARTLRTTQGSEQAAAGQRTGLARGARAPDREERTGAPEGRSDDFPPQGTGAGLMTPTPTVTVTILDKEYCIACPSEARASLEKIGRAHV